MPRRWPLDQLRETFTDHIKGSDLCSDGRDCGCRHDLAPRALGRSAEWDYRYCWLRDATFTLLALMHLGYYDEARAWRDWLVRAVAGSPQQVQIMYGVGESDGYRN